MVLKMPGRRGVRRSKGLKSLPAVVLIVQSVCITFIAIWSAFEGGLFVETRVDDDCSGEEENWKTDANLCKKSRRIEKIKLN